MLTLEPAIAFQGAANSGLLATVVQQLASIASRGRGEGAAEVEASMFFIAAKMLMGDKAKYFGILMGVTLASPLHATRLHLRLPDGANVRVI